MKTETLTKTWYVSEVLPEVRGSDQIDGEVIAWADAMPVVWKIVTGNKSKVFGQNASTYLGSERGPSPSCILARAISFRHALEAVTPEGWTPRSPDNFFVCRARFTLEHYNDKGFKGGLFQQFDGQYDRGCAHLDYTPSHLDEVIARFQAWCDSSYKFETREIRINGKTVRTYPAPKKETRTC